MLVMAMTTGEMGLYRFESNRIYDSCCVRRRFSSIGTSNFRPPILAVLPPEKIRKSKKTWRLGLSVLNSSGGSDILEKEPEFKPAFGEYLKAMEAITERRQACQSSRPKPTNGSTEKAASDEGLRLVKKDEVFKATEIRQDMRAEADVRVRRSRSTVSSSSSSKVFVDDGDDKRVTIRNRSEAQMGGKVAARVSGAARSNLVLVVGTNGVTREVKGARNGRSNKKVLIDDKELDVERAAFRNFDESSDVVDKPKVSQAEMEERIQKLAKSLNGADIDIPEWLFSRMMRNARIKFMDYSILRVIQVLGKLGNWRRVLQVIEWLQMRERYKSHRLRHILTTALTVLKRARRPVEALNLFQTMQQQVSSYPDMVAYHAIAVTLGQAGHLRELFDVIDTMRSPKIKPKTNILRKWNQRMEPDLVVYHAVLNACAQRKQWEGAFWVLQQLKLKGQLPSSVTYGLVMEVMFSCGKYSLVHEFFRKIQKSSMPGALTYRVLVNTFWKEGKIDEAVSTVQDMEKRGIVGSAALYYDLARCLCSAGRSKEALMQIEKICKVASKPLVVTYTGLVQACLDSGNIQDGSYIFTEMQRFCSPNLVTFNIMLKAYLEHGLFDEAKDIFQTMSDDPSNISSKSDFKHQVVPDIHSFNLMLDACIKEKRWDVFELTYVRMLHYGYHFNPNRHLHMVLDAARAGKGEALEKTWEYLSLADRIPPPALLKERFCMKLENDDHASALLSLTSHSLRESSAFSRMAWMKLLNENAYRFREETIVQLVHELHILVARSESQNLVLQNLLVTAKEFLRSHFRHREVFVKATLCTA